MNFNDLKEARDIAALFDCAKCGLGEVRLPSQAATPTKLRCASCGQLLFGTVGEARDLLTAFGLRHARRILNESKAEQASEVVGTRPTVAKVQKI